MRRISDRQFLGKYISLCAVLAPAAQQDRSESSSCVNARQASSELSRYARRAVCSATLPKFHVLTRTSLNPQRSISAASSLDEGNFATDPGK